MWEWLLEKLRVPGRGWGVTDLARRLDVTVASLRETEIRYRSFEIPERAGGYREIEAPEADMKRIQRRI